MAIWMRAILIAGSVLFAAGCGTASSGPPANGKLTSAGPTASASAPATNLANASLLGTSWLSGTLGFALAAQPCATGTCTRLARTTDAGRHWHMLPDPLAGIKVSVADCSAQPCVTQISFASPAVGYLYGPAPLLMTTDGGLTWHSQQRPQTEALTIAGRQVYRVSYTSTGCPGPCHPSLQVAPTGSAKWRTLIGDLAEPGRSDAAQIVASGQDLLVAMYGSLAGPIPAQAVIYRSANGGGTWHQATDPCNGLGPRGQKQEEDLIGLTAAPGGFFAGLCGPHNITSTFVITSSDAGATWRRTAALPPDDQLSLVASASPATIAVASGQVGGSGRYTARLLVTTDGGKHWVTAATDSQHLTSDALDPTSGGAPAWIGFQTPLAGHWLADPHGIWSTTDGGRHWTRTAFR
jgi:photosystem II stability/assembly factor-like uncharacterized protein